jgi:hypothetical protein
MAEKSTPEPRASKRRAQGPKTELREFKFVVQPILLIFEGDRMVGDDKSGEFTGVESRIHKPVTEPEPSKRSITHEPGGFPPFRKLLFSQPEQSGPHVRLRIIRRLSAAAETVALGALKRPAQHRDGGTGGLGNSLTADPH